MAPRTKKATEDTAKGKPADVDANPLAALIGAVPEAPALEVGEEVEPTADGVVLPGSPAHAAALEVGYGMTVEDARTIIRERDAGVGAWPYPEYKKAKALIEAFESDHSGTTSRKPGPLSTRA